MPADIARRAGISVNPVAYQLSPVCACACRFVTSYVETFSYPRHQQAKWLLGNHKHAAFHVRCLSSEVK